MWHRRPVSSDESSHAHSVDLTIRPATDDDVLTIQRTLFEAVTWQGKKGVPPFEEAITHPDFLMYYEDWGRSGDFGVIAELNDEVIGAAYGRTFTNESHGYGFVDETTPELAIAVWGDARGVGVGTALMKAFHLAAADEGFAAVSLSVNHGNFAEAMYRNLGYLEVEDDGDSVLMLKEL